MAFVHPPVARKKPTKNTLHGHTLPDDYAWLREKSSSEVIAYLNAENAYTAAVMAPLAGLEQKLYSEMLSHIKETDVSVPYRDGDYFYYTRTTEGLQYATHCRRAVRTPSDPACAYDDSLPEQITLDVNQLAQGQAFMALGAFQVSPDSNLLAYTTDNTGYRQYTLHLRDLRTGVDLVDTATLVGSLAWTADSQTLFYTVEDDATKRQYRLYRHRVGSAGPDALVFEELDERFSVGTGKTRDGEYIVLETASHITTEYHVLPASGPEGQLRIIAPRIDGQKYYIDHRHGFFYLRANDKGPNYRLVRAPASTPGREYWNEIVSQQTDVSLEDFDVFDSFIAISKRIDGLPKLSVHRFNGNAFAKSGDEISFPEPTYSAYAHTNRQFQTNAFRYSYQSLVTPASVYSYDLERGISTLLKQQEVPGGFDRNLYSSERIFATASDGVQVPISLVYRKDRFKRDGTNPLYLYGYGSYGYSLPVGFNGNRLSLLDRGLVLAYAHIRGGGDLGDPWHDAGKMQAKRTTFTDFISVTEKLIAEGYGAKDRVAIEGGSAGGLLMGAVVNLRPGLFRAVLSHVPFVDVMNTMLDASLPLTIAEYEEWGNPNEKAAFEYMLSYSPYDNLKRGAYPAMLVKTSLNDSQVMYWEPAKYVARLRTLKTNNSPLLLHINMDAGHGGASGRYDYLHEIAFDYAFLLAQLGVEKSF